MCEVETGVDLKQRRAGYNVVVDKKNELAFCQRDAAVSRSCYTPFGLLMIRQGQPGQERLDYALGFRVYAIANNNYFKALRRISLPAEPFESSLQDRWAGKGRYDNA